jgi:hypothetical protein
MAVQDQDTRPDLTLSYRADPGKILHRTMKIVGNGINTLFDSLLTQNYEDAKHTARRLSNIWIEGHGAYQMLVSQSCASIETLRSLREMLVAKQQKLLGLLGMMLERKISRQLRTDTRSLYSLLADIRPAVPVDAEI